MLWSSLMLIWGAACFIVAISGLVDAFIFQHILDLCWSVCYIAVGMLGVYAAIKQDPTVSRMYMKALGAFAVFYIISSIVVLIYINYKLSDKEFAREMNVRKGDEQAFITGSIIVFLILVFICSACLFCACKLTKTTEHYAMMVTLQGPPPPEYVDQPLHYQPPPLPPQGYYD
jgi:hypothetical protein